MRQPKPVAANDYGTHAEEKGLQMAHDVSVRTHLAEFMYFSYVTLTTVGYGDVTPVTLQARSLAILEAIGGVLFIGALVARIAGTFEAVQSDPSDRD